MNKEHILVYHLSKKANELTTLSKVELKHLLKSKETILPQGGGRAGGWREGRGGEEGGTLDFK